MKYNTIVVTGASGYIASWIIRDLLEEGYKVRVTVRDKSKSDKYQHLLDIEKEMKGSLEIFEADLNVQGSFDRAIDGADIVIHTASPFFMNDKNDPQKHLIHPAVNGTRNVLASVNKYESVKRVVLTSSIAAIYGDNKDLSDKGYSALREDMWNFSSSLRHNAYAYSKTRAERAAWSMARKQNRWDLVTIHPGFVMGPSLTRRVDSTSIETILRILRGELGIGSPDLEFVFSDVRDVARGHLLAAFKEEAKGRYIIANESASLLDVGKIIDDAYKGLYKVPKRLVPKFLVVLVAPLIGFTRSYTNKNVAYPLKADHSKSIKELNMEYHSLKETVLDHVRQLRDDDLI
jgi:nucleoside-diphosphate-sugar epimerase